MNIRIDPNSREAIYLQIVSQVREGAARGSLAPGEKLPSVRELSKRLVVNPNTVARAYTELERDGVLVTRPGLGVFVVEPSQDRTVQSRRRELTELVDRMLTSAVHLGFSKEEAITLIKDRADQFLWAGADGSKRKRS